MRGGWRRDSWAALGLALLAACVVAIGLRGVLRAGAAATVNPNDFAILGAESSATVANDIGTGAPTLGGKLDTTDEAGAANSDNDGIASTPDGRTLMIASGGGNVSVCLNVNSGSPDCKGRSVKKTPTGWSDVDTVGITADGTFGIVNDGTNLGRILIDSGGNPTAGETITLTGKTASGSAIGSIGSLVIAPTPVSPGHVRVLAKDDNGNIEVISNVSTSGGAGAGYSEGPVISDAGVGGDGTGGMIFSPIDNTRAVVASASGLRLITGLDTGSPVIGAPLDATSGGCSTKGGDTAAISADGRFAVTDCGSKLVVADGVSTGTLTVARVVQSNLTDISSLAVTKGNTAVMTGSSSGGSGLDLIGAFDTPQAAATDPSKVLKVDPVPANCLLVFPVVGFTPNATTSTTSQSTQTTNGQRPPPPPPPTFAPQPQPNFNNSVPPPPPPPPPAAPAAPTPLSSVDQSVAASSGAMRTSPASSSSPSSPPPAGTPAAPLTSIIPAPVEQPATAPASPAAPPPPSLRVDRPSVGPGDDATARGTGCPSGSSVRLQVDGQDVGSAAADERGAFTTRVQFPQSVPLGVRDLVAECSGQTLRVPITFAVNTAAAGTPSGVLAATLAFFILIGLILFTVRSEGPPPVSRRGENPYVRYVEYLP